MKGETVAIVGESGSGKSVTMKAAKQRFYECASGGTQREGSAHRERGNFTRSLMIKFISGSFGSNLAQSRNSLLSTNGQNKINYRYATW